MDDGRSLSARIDTLDVVISLRCTVLDVDHPEQAVDVDVVAPAGATSGDLADALRDEGLLAPGRTLTSGGAAVPASSRLGRRPLVSGALLVASRERHLSSPAARGLLELQVVSGPDAGRVLPLRPGTVTVGRAATTTLPLDDPDLSREHLFVTLDGDGLLVGDLDSSNGTTVDGQAVGNDGTRLAPDQRVTAGSSTLVVRPAATRPAASRPTDDGAIEVSRGPRCAPTLPPVTVHRPGPPSPRPPAKPPWLGALAPAAVCLPVALFAHQPTYLLLGLLSPLTVAASYLADRSTRRRDERQELSAWRTADDEAARRVDAAVHQDAQHRRLLVADAAELAATARGPGHRLWERGPADDDLLDVVVGRAEQDARVVVTGEDAPVTPTVDDAPLVLPLGDVGHLGFCGDARRVRAAVRLLVTRLCVGSTPRAVRLVVVARSGWAWTRWLPHSHPASMSAVARTVRERATRAGTSGCPARPALVVLLDDPQRWSTDPSLATVLDDGPAAGVHVIALAAEPPDLPSACGATVTVPSHGRATLRRRDRSSLEVSLDGVSTDWSEDVARALAPLRDATPDPGGLPDRVTLRQLSAVDPTSASAIASAWRRQPRSTAALVGADAEGPLRLDLVRDGPHALVAGTTGSGKSELLQTLVTSLSLANRPDELSFVLVDYKGGAAFRELADLPHVVGLVTDLDAHLAERALASLQAELTRRERLLAEVGAADLAAYQACAAPPQWLGRLVLVVDEFRLLATELPQFLDGLVRLAAVGRSLGVHLVLATQRPGGVVSADIKANVNLRICLRVRDRVDSDDVLEAPDAAALPQDVPGRALCRTGSTPLTPFQVALSAVGTADREPDGVRVRRVGEPTDDTDGERGLAAVVRAIQEAATSCGALSPPSPWLPALPDVLTDPDLEADGNRESARPASALDVPGAVRLGLVDLPAEGARRPFTWHPVRSSHLAVSGTSRTGRTTALVGVALGLAESFGPDTLHLHVIESGDALSRALAGLAHLGSTVSSREPQLVARLVARLGAMARAGAHATSTVLLIDGWESLVEELDRVDHGRATDALLALMRDGEPTGLRVVVAGGRGVLTSRLGSLVAERLLLRAADPTDLLLGGAPSAAPLAHQPPGRAVHVPSGAEVQLAWPGTEQDVRGRVERVRSRYLDAPGDGAQPPPVRVQPLPSCVELTSLAGLGRPAGLLVTVGVGGDDAAPAQLDLADHRVVVVSGPPRSGRSTTLASIAHQLHGRGSPVVVVAAPHSPLARGPWPVVTPQTLLGGRLDPVAPGTGGGDTACLVVDDLDLLGGDVDAYLAEQHRPVVVAMTADHLGQSFRGVGAVVRRHRTGVLLHPSRPSDGEPFGTPAERPDCPAPGRGLLVVRGVATPLQVALPPSG